jgi:hypothetical protein
LSDFRVVAKRSKKFVKERFFVTIVEAGNGKTLFTSEMLRDRSYAVELGQRFAATLDGNFINLT